MMWIVSVTEALRVTRIVCNDETHARRVHKHFLPLVGEQYLAVSLQAAPEEPMRSGEEKRRAALLLTQIAL